MKLNYYVCETCGNIVEKVKNSGVPVVCCGKPMKELVPGTTDAAIEKHIPVIEVSGNKVTVTVGSVEHPMVEVHFIEWITLETEKGLQRKYLKPEEKPVAEFILTEDDKLIAADAYCNLHGLWRAEV